jgi:hypothetical protein
MHDHVRIVEVLEDLTTQSEQIEIKKIIASLVTAAAAKAMPLNADGTTAGTKFQGMRA